jgi:membrane protein YdbS with pleckstrin-like domain
MSARDAQATPSATVGTVAGTGSENSYDPGDEGLSWTGPSPRLRTLRRYEVVGATVLAAAVFALVGALAGGPGDAGVGVAVGIVGGLVADAVAGRRCRAWGYCERPGELLVRRGVLVRRLSVIPYGRMQYVEVKAGPFERMYGLATVQMHTAAAASDARIPGLAAADAARLRDQLTSFGERQASGL